MRKMRKYKLRSMSVKVQSGNTLPGCCRVVTTIVVKIPFLLWAIHNTPNFRIVIGFFEQNLAKTISVYVHKSNDLRRLPKVIFIENFCYWSLQQQWQKTATWRSQQLSAWIFYPIFVSNAKSQVFRSFFLGYVRNILHVAPMK